MRDSIARRRKAISPPAEKPCLRYSPYQYSVNTIESVRTEEAAKCTNTNRTCSRRSAKRESNSARTKSSVAMMYLCGWAPFDVEHSVKGVIRAEQRGMKLF